jgi:thymidylate synthase
VTWPQTECARNGAQVLTQYRSTLARLCDAPRVESVRSPASVGSGWGERDRPFREAVAERLCIDTDDVLLSSRTRPLNARYALASSAWLVLGRNDVASITRFNSRGSAFSLDGHTLSGAFGHRLRSCGVDQLERHIELLRADPTSRRALGVVGTPADTLPNTPDFPCATSVQFLLRADRLRCVVHMRSQAMFGVFPYDLVNFRYLQTYMAWRLGCRPGELDFIVGSLHIYEEEIDRIVAFCAETSARFCALPALPWDRLDEEFSMWTSEQPGPGRLTDLLGSGMSA